MKTFSFSLTDAEAQAMEANIDLLIYEFPDLTRETALIAVMRMGSEEILRRIKTMEAAHGNS